MSKEPLDYVRHIFDECNYINSVCSHLERKQFENDETLKRAVVRSLEIIGEATKKVPVDFKFELRSIQWKNMAGMRDRLIHEYHGVNYNIVWDVVKIKSQNYRNKLRKYWRVNSAFVYEYYFNEV